MAILRSSPARPVPARSGPVALERDRHWPWLSQEAEAEGEWPFFDPHRHDPFRHDQDRVRWDRDRQWPWGYNREGEIEGEGRFSGPAKGTGPGKKADPIETDCEKDYKRSKSKCFDVLLTSLALAKDDKEVQEIVQRYTKCRDLCRKAKSICDSQPV